MQKAPQVVAVIVTWNKKKDVIRLLRQLSKIDYPAASLEIVLVDNNSEDGTCDLVKKEFPLINLLQNKENLGGAGGFNTGMCWALQNRPLAEYLWLLDNDVQVDQKALQILVKVMTSRPKAAICGSRIMDSLNPTELIEVGAFIDYTIGDIRQNFPDLKQTRPSEIFEVDYVAACSLLARTKAVRQVGLWHQKFFIYWDDMEWGARFNRCGYEVLAANASIVYHPSWAGRTVDNSAIWRNYYRSRNALCFFNNYAQGLSRRRALVRLILRYSKQVSINGIGAYTSQAFSNGMYDFFRGVYGKKEFKSPPDDLNNYLTTRPDTSLCIFVQDAYMAQKAHPLMLKLKKEFPNLKVLSIIQRNQPWTGISNPKDILNYAHKNGAIPWRDRFRIIHFLYKKSWNLIITSPLTPKIAVVFGRAVVRIDFQYNQTLIIEKASRLYLATLPLRVLISLAKVIIMPPRQELKN